MKHFQEFEFTPYLGTLLGVLSMDIVMDDVLPVDVVVKLVIAGKGHESAPSYTEGEENLASGVRPNLCSREKQQPT